MRKVLWALWLGVWAFLSPGAEAQQAKVRATLEGVFLDVVDCVLEGSTLTCQIEASNPLKEKRSLDLSRAIVQALGDSGLLYGGSVSPERVELGPGGRASLKATFRGVSEPNGYFLTLRLGEASFHGIQARGAGDPAIQLVSAQCLFLAMWDYPEVRRGFGAPALCLLQLVNRSGRDLALALNPERAHLYNDEGRRVAALRAFVGVQLVNAGWLGTIYSFAAEPKGVAEVTLPPGVPVRVGFLFDYDPYGLPANHMPKLVPLVETGIPGIGRLRDVPFRACEDYKSGYDRTIAAKGVCRVP